MVVVLYRGKVSDPIRTRLPFAPILIAGRKSVVRLPLNDDSSFPNHTRPYGVFMWHVAFFPRPTLRRIRPGAVWRCRAGVIISNPVGGGVYVSK